MRLPWMLRINHEAIMDAMQINLDSRNDVIEAFSELAAKQQTRIKELEEQVTSLTKLVTEYKCNDYTQKPPEKEKPKLHLITSGRAGWRRRAEQATLATIPPPADSVQALERRVIEQGGKV